MAFMLLPKMLLNAEARHLCTMVQNSKNHRKPSHVMIHCPISKGLSTEQSERCEQTSEHSGACEQNKQGGTSERVCGASESASVESNIINALVIVFASNCELISTILGFNCLHLNAVDLPTIKTLTATTLGCKVMNILNSC